jgi:hypothetical protein
MRCILRPSFYDAFGARVLQTGTTTTTFYPFKWYSSKPKYFPSQIAEQTSGVRAALSARSLALWRRRERKIFQLPVWPEAGALQL